MDDDRPCLICILKEKQIGLVKNSFLPYGGGGGGGKGGVGQKVVDMSATISFFYAFS